MEEQSHSRMEAMEKINKEKQSQQFTLKTKPPTSFPPPLPLFKPL
jgi:hypothetical protein